MGSNADQPLTISTNGSHLSAPLLIKKIEHFQNIGLENRYMYLWVNQYINIVPCCNTMHVGKYLIMSSSNNGFSKNYLVDRFSE